MSHVRQPYRYRLVDVFTTEPFEGNPVTVFTDAYGLDDCAMQLIARELNRRSMLHVVMDGDAIDVGGYVASVATGQFTL